MIVHKLLNFNDSLNDESAYEGNRNPCHKIRENMKVPEIPF